MAPGIYKMLDKDLKPLYIGKAKVLAKRVVSYANIDKLPNRLRQMVSQLDTIDYITTETEAEALLLEASLIQSIKPPFNILLKDDRSFPYIVIEGEHPYPRIAKYRGKKKAGVSYYGPFASAGNVNQAIIELQKLFLIRPCTNSYFAARERPCLQYQIKRCSAPCVQKISVAEYAEHMKQAKDFLSGKSTKVQEKLQKEMQEASSLMEYEKAAVIRDRIRMFTQIQARNMFTQHNIEEGDIIAVYKDDKDIACIQVFFIRGNKNYGNKPYFLKETTELTESEILQSFMGQFYQNHIPPKHIICSCAIDSKSVFEEALAKLSHHKVTINHIKSGVARDFMNFALENAHVALEKHRHENLKNMNAMREIMTLFSLKRIPKRIEVYDNSHIQGDSPVGCFVVAGADGFHKSEYRTFNIKGVEKGDDYRMLREVLTRRFSRIKADNYPDLIIIDGGKGHLSTALDVMQSFGISDITLVCMSKGMDRDAGREYFHMGNQKAFQLPKGDHTLYYLQVLRDEAHRYAIATHRKRRHKKISLSGLDNIPNIGKARKRVLLTHFGSIDAIKNAKIVDLKKVPGISKKIAEIVVHYFHAK